jgi:hypothetical protein
VCGVVPPFDGKKLQVTGNKANRKIFSPEKNKMNEKFGTSHTSNKEPCDSCTAPVIFGVLVGWTSG